MVKILGYLIALLGLGIVILSFNIKRLNIALPTSLKTSYIMIAGLAIVIIGVAFTLKKKSSNSKITQATEEVPIYEGEGKQRKIVGYKKEGKK